MTVSAQLVADQLVDLAVRRGATYAQCFVERRADVRSGSRNGLPTGISVSVHAGAGLTVNLGGRWLFRSAPAHALGTLVEWLNTHGARRDSRPDPILPGIDMETVTHSGDKRPYGHASDALVDVVYDYRERLAAVADSHGRRTASRLRGVRTLCDVAMSRSGSVVRGFSRRWDTDVDHPGADAEEELIREATNQAASLLGARHVGEVTSPVVLGPGAAAAFMHELVGHAVELDNYRRGSDYTNALAAGRLTSVGLRMLDDPAQANGSGSQDVDDDGVPSRAVVLIDDGVVRHQLDSIRSRFGSGVGELNGHGRRQDFRHPSLPRATNTVVAPQQPGANIRDVTSSSLLEICSFNGGWVNLTTGEFSFTTLAATLLTPGGNRLPVAGARLSGHALRTLDRLSAVGDDSGVHDGVCSKQGQSVGIGICSPSLRFESLKWHS